MARDWYSSDQSRDDCTSIGSSESIASDPVDSDFSIIFVLGGPGAGKGTQCANIARNFYVKHLSVGDVLRTERDTPGSPYGETVARNMEEGRIGPMNLTVELLKNAIEAARQNDGWKVFMIDGFPRKMDQLHFFESTVSRAIFALFLDSSEDVRLLRLQQRAMIENRRDDTADTIQKRFHTFNDTCMVVVKHMYEQRRLRGVDANGDIGTVYAEVESALMTTLGERLERRRIPMS